MTVTVRVDRLQPLTDHSGIFKQGVSIIAGVQHRILRDETSGICETDLWCEKSTRREQSLTEMDVVIL